jgi:inhibitor of the pro-sigma K processing machinery
MNIGMWSLVSFAVAVALLVLLGKLLAWPIKKLSRIIVNSLLGGLILVVFNLAGSFIGLHISINPLNALIVGVFGVPGLALLFVLPMLLS